MRTFSELFPDFFRTFSILSQGLSGLSQEFPRTFLRTFFGHSQNFLRTLPGLSYDFLRTFSGLSHDFLGFFENVKRKSG